MKTQQRLLVLGLMMAGCGQLVPGFSRFQLINQTPYAITYYAVAHSEKQVRNAKNLLDAALPSGGVSSAPVAGMGTYWLRAIADVDGTPTEKIAGPVWIANGHVGWAWRLVDGAIQAGTKAQDVFAQTDLPAVVIDSFGQTIPDEPKVPALLHVTNDPLGGLHTPLGQPVDYRGVGAIELRGYSTQAFAKQSFGFETRDEEGHDQDASILGLPEEEDWVLYGPYMDRSLMRTVLGYSLYAGMGWYAPRTRFCEVYLKDYPAGHIEETYHGVYVLTEKLKRDAHRVDIAALDETAVVEPAISGGYLLELHGAEQQDPGERVFPVAGDFLLSIKYPKPEKITGLQFAWIRRYVGDFEAALFGPDFTDPGHGYAAYIDVASFVDYILLQDFLKNRDAFRASVFLYKDRQEKLCLGPIWDLNIAMGYYSFSGFQDPTGWFLQSPYRKLPHSPWTDRLFEDPAFAQRYRQRWDELRQGLLSTASLNQRIDGYAAHLATAQVRNFIRWNSLGRTLFPRIDLLMYMGPHPDSYAGEVQLLKDWMAQRAEWMDGHIDELL